MKNILHVIGRSFASLRGWLRSVARTHLWIIFTAAGVLFAAGVFVAVVVLSPPEGVQV
jgi:hypothetical protein